jgi:uncharacterized protein YwqG
MTEQEKKVLKEELLYETELLINNRINSVYSEIKKEINQNKTKEENIFNKLTVLDSWTFTGVLRHSTSAPTHTPKNKKEQIVLLDDGINHRLYIYINGEWKYASLT